MSQKSAYKRRSSTIVSQGGRLSRVAPRGKSPAPGVGDLASRAVTNLCLWTGALLLFCLLSLLCFEGAGAERSGIPGGVLLGLLLCNVYNVLSALY